MLQSKIKISFVLFILLFVIISNKNCYSQEKEKMKFNDPNYNPDDYDLMDGLRRKKAAKLEAEGKQDEVAAKKKAQENKKVYTIVLPFIGYNPFLGLAIGAGGNISFRLGDKKTTRISNIVPSYTWTTENQNIARMNSSIYTRDEKFYIFSSMLWSVAPQNTYGIGSATPEEWKTSVTPSTLRFIGRVYRKVYKKLYAGINYNVDSKYEIHNETAEGIQKVIHNGTSSDGIQSEIDSKYNGLTSFWESENVDQSGFKSDYDGGMGATDLQQKYYYTPFDQNYYATGTGDKYLISGLGVNVMWDTRDNVNSAFKGTYINFMANFYGDWIGSDYNFTNIYLDMRHYFQLSQNNRQILGIWGLANLTTGNAPYLNLPRIGGDDWFASGRGYTAGRYVGKDLLYLEAEYRINIYKWFGMTCFLNVTGTNNRDGNFEEAIPGAGIGFRLKAIKATRTNIAIDIGAGKDGSSGVYMRFIEAF